MFIMLIKYSLGLTLKEPGGGIRPPPLRHFLLYLCRLLFFRAETSWLFFFKPCARFKTIFIKIGLRVMTQRCVIATKNWFSIEITHKSCFLSFLSFRIHFHYVLSYSFGLFGVRTCVSILWHPSLLKMQLLLKKIEKNHDFGDFWWFSCFDMTSLMTSLWLHTSFFFEFFWYQWTREGHSYPLVPHTWCFIDVFPRS